MQQNHIVMPTIRIDEDVYAFLQSRAKPFEDTPNSVLRRVLHLEHGEVDVPTEGGPEMYKGLIVEYLRSHGGRAEVQQVLGWIYQRVSKSLTASDLEPVPSGNEPRWRNSARWARKKLVEEGILKNNSRGVWELL